MVVSVILPKSSSCSSSSTSTSTETLSAGRGFFLSLSSSPLPSPPSSLPSPPVRVGGTSIPLSPWLSFSPLPWLSFSLWPWLFPLLSPFSSASSDPKIFYTCYGFTPIGVAIKIKHYLHVFWTPSWEEIFCLWIFAFWFFCHYFFWSHPKSSGMFV